MNQLKEGLITVHDAASALNITVAKVDYHFRYHEEHLKSKDLVKIVMKIKSDLLDTYEELQRSFAKLKTKDRAEEPQEIRMKIELSKEIRALKKDLNDFIKRHSNRIAMEHQDLENQWKHMAEFLMHDACDDCKNKLGVFLEPIEI